MNEINKEQVHKILEAYRVNISKVKEALKLANVPEPLVEVYSVVLPQFDKMLPNDVVLLFNDIKTMIILYLDYQQFSHREIARRIGVSHKHVGDVLKRYKEQMDELNSLQEKNESTKD